MQQGHLIKHRSSWAVRYYDWVHVQGKPVRKLKFRKIGPLKAYTKAQAQVEVQKILAPINSKAVAPDASMSVADFIDNVYLPHVKKNLRASTHSDYEDMFRLHLKKHLESIALKDFQTSHGQRMFRTIAETSELSHKRLLRFKAFIQGAFRHARQEGIINHPNPLHDVSVKGKRSTFKPQAYTLDEIGQMYMSLGKRDFFVVFTAALTGLRLSEIRGLRWADFKNGELHVRRSVWRTVVGAPKTYESEAAVPCVPVLQEMLTNYRKSLTKFNSDNDYIFAGERRGVPLNLHNLANRNLKPIFKEKGIAWKGWHGFRRGLASNLYALEVSPKVIAAILRHAGIGTTLQFYVQTTEAESSAALDKMKTALWSKIKDSPQYSPQPRK
jgi:integrase